jgi:hypothetical protein
MPIKLNEQANENLDKLEEWYMAFIYNCLKRHKKKDPRDLKLGPFT